MIGIVVVSHSPLVAAGVVDIAREMAGSEVPIEAVGGLALPNGAIAFGTDPVRIGQAIERVYSDDGVLILVDLGSALLSAEIAVEGLAEEWRSRVFVCDAPLVEGTLAAAVQARAGSTLAAVAAEARGALRPKIEHLSSAPVAPGPSPLADAPVHRLRVNVANRLGLHARPASRLVQIATSSDGTIRARNATTGGPWQDGRSIVGLLALGLRQGHDLEIEATGPNALELLPRVDALARAGFDDPSEAGGPAPTPRPAPDVVVDPRTLVGIPAVEGFARGPAIWFDVPEDAADERLSGDPLVEWARLTEAIDAAASELSTTHFGTTSREHENARGIFAAHHLILRDPTLRSAARREIDGQHATAAVAWRHAVAAAVGLLRSTGDPIIQERAVDVEDVGARVSTLLTGKERLKAPDQDGVLLADDLSPSDAASIDSARIRGVALARGAPTNHASVLLRAARIPTVVGLGSALRSVATGATILVDGTSGRLIVEPTELVRDSDALRPRSAVETELRPSVVEPVPAVTRGGRRIMVQANVATVDDARAANLAGADGIGLVRSEFLFIGRQSPPDEEEQTNVYQSIAAAMPDRHITIRTLDVGGDKSMRFLIRPTEANPALGVRGLRLSLAEPELFRAQLRAILRVAARAQLRVMLPMVSTIVEVREARRWLEISRDELVRRGETAPARVDLGIMVEIPAAVDVVRQFAAEIDFVSIGTNDLAQYTMAADRDNSAVASLADALQPSVLRLIAEVATTGRKHGIDAAICGEIAGGVGVVPLLVGLGITQLSVRPTAVAAVKEAVSDVDDDRAARLAASCLAAPDATAVRALLLRK